MSKLKSIVEDSLLEARWSKDRVKLSFYQTFLGEIEKTEKDKKKPITDSQINAQALKWKKNLLETSTIAAANGREGTVELAANELELINQFVPTYSLTGTSLLDTVQSTIENLDLVNIGTVMKTLAANHKGLYDPREAKEVTEVMIGS